MGLLRLLSASPHNAKKTKSDCAEPKRKNGNCSAHLASELSGIVQGDYLEGQIRHLVAIHLVERNGLNYDFYYAPATSAFTVNLFWLLVVLRHYSFR